MEGMRVYVSVWMVLEAVKRVENTVDFFVDRNTQVGQRKVNSAFPAIIFAVKKTTHTNMSAYLGI